jgi:hypothetical protein
VKHYDVLEKIAAGLEPNIYVELGIFRGKTFNLVARHAAKAYAADVQDAGRHIKCNNAEFFKGTTQEFSAHWDKNIQKQIGLIFIDADHSKKSVVSDVNNFYKWLEPDSGLMVLHDTWPLSKAKTAPGYSGDCYLAPGWIKLSYPEAEVLTLPFLCGLTLIRKPGGDWRNGKY